MKKLMTSTLILTAFSFALPCFAFIDSERLLSEDYLRNQDYSPETIRMMNLKMIDPYDDYIEPESKINLNPLVYMKKFWQYMDPAFDNERFGKGIINANIDRPSGL